MPIRYSLDTGPGRAYKQPGVPCYMCKKSLDGRLRLWIPKLKVTEKSKHVLDPSQHRWGGTTYKTVTYEGTDVKEVPIHPLCLREMLADNRCPYCYGPRSSGKKCLKCTMQGENLKSFRQFNSRGGSCAYCEVKTESKSKAYRLGRETYHGECLDKAAKGCLPCEDCKKEGKTGADAWHIASKMEIFRSDDLYIFFRCKPHYERYNNTCSECKQVKKSSDFVNFVENRSSSYYSYSSQYNKRECKDCYQARNQTCPDCKELKLPREMAMHRHGFTNKDGFHQKEPIYKCKACFQAKNALSIREILRN